jgi:hypothetical protein
MRYKEFLEALEKEKVNKRFFRILFFLILHNRQQQFGSFYELDIDKLTSLEIHFGQLNLLELFLFKNQKDLCQNHRCQEEQKTLDT